MTLLPVRPKFMPRLAACALLLLLATPAGAQAPDGSVSPPRGIPVSEARDGLPAALSYLMRQGFTATNAYYTGDPNLYTFLHWEEFIPHNLVRRNGAVSVLSTRPDERVAGVRAESSLGEMPLDALIEDPRSRIQGWLVVHRGRIIFETYPGMREDDHHLWFSVSKTLAGLAVGLLEQDGLIDVQLPIDDYLPEIGASHWGGIRIIDILDMASGLDLHENEQSRTDRFHTVGAFFRIELGDTSDLGQLTSDQILFSAGEAKPPGEVFEYSSLNTKMLGLLAERVSGQRLADFLSERVWSKMGAEGDGLLGVNREGGPAVYGMMSSRLRDLARYGMLYTPSRTVVADGPVVPEALIERIQTGCRHELYRKALEARGAFDPGAERRCNSRQWDVVWDDGDLYKGGARGQGLYVSPARDLVVAWFSTTSESGWMNYARAIAKSLEPRP
ncbi:serine hydrolase domain-containing protein [Elongatibacter sediminis]|uniref:Serine hydrolase domain-containing protein n=1 Tax=Elongatibacter sediminis TaxID=3119006 RepID=A0AAW9RBB9_9GAMM